MNLNQGKVAGGLVDELLEVIHRYDNSLYMSTVIGVLELVRADERKANIGCIGRIAAMVVDPIDQARLYEAMDAIRARGEMK